MSRVIADGLSARGKADSGVFHTGNFDPSGKQDRQGGLTVDRPATPSQFEFYFDTDLGKPIWFDGTGWVDATGAVV